MNLLEDPWLSEHLGKPVFRCTGELPATLPAGLIYAKLPAADLATVRSMQALGFQLVDTALSFECPLPLPKSAAHAAQARMAVPGDEPAVARIAREVFTFDRFHTDPNIPDETADRVKEAWTRGFFAGKRGKWMVVAEINDEVAGFLLLLESQDKLVIDLIAVADRHRGAGVARTMIAFAADALPQFATLLVGTQATNTASVRLYESMGFRLVGAQHVLHCHR